MQVSENIMEVLNDLIRINNDRIAGYDRAKSEAKDLDVDLKAMFDKMIEESRTYKSELIEKVNEVGGTYEDNTTTAGDIYRAWMDVKATFAGNDRQAILESCEFGEDAAQRAYEAALSTDDLDGDTRALISEQQAALKNSHDVIKRYRDAHKALKN